MTITLRLAVQAAALAAVLAGAALADAPFTGRDPDFSARLRAGAAGNGALLAGGTAEISGRGLKPGQTVTFRQNGTPLADGQSFAVDGKGQLSASFPIPAGAQPGVWPVVAEFAGPDFASIVDLKISAAFPTVAEDRYSETSVRLQGGLYQVGYSAREDALYVTSSVGRGTPFAAIYKLNPETLAIEAQVTPPEAPAGADGKPGGYFGAYGVTVSDATGQLWVTNTTRNSVAVYSLTDLSLIRQFPEGSVQHPREAAVWGGKAYVGEVFTNKVAVIDAGTLEPAGTIELESGKRGESFGVGGVALDDKGGRLLVSSMTTGEVAVIDLASGAVSGVYATPARGTVAVAYDPVHDRAVLPGQETDSVAFVDLATGETVHTVSVGAAPLTALTDPETGLTWVTARLADRLVALDETGTIVADIPSGSRPNHIATDGRGTLFVVNKSAGPDDDAANMLTRITASE